MAHRGFSAKYPENTVVAFLEAMEAGADGVELDVRQCASGELVVFHDEDLLRLCGDSRSIDQMTWAQLGSLRTSDEPIPSLEEVLRALPKALVNIELKSVPLSDAWALARACHRVISRCRALSRVLVSSFDPRLLLMLRVLEPNLHTGLLFAKKQSLVLRRGWLAKGACAVAVHPEDVLVTYANVARWKSRGMAVHVWTVDNPERIVNLRNMGVDALICNDPAAAVAVLECWRSRSQPDFPEQTICQDNHCGID